MATAPIETTTPVDAPPANDAAIERPREITPADMYPDDLPQSKEQPEAADEQLVDDQDGEEVDPNVNDEIPKIEPPKSWPGEDAEKFKKLIALGPEGVELAEVVSRREAERDNYVAQKGREAAQTRQQVETEARTAIQQVYDASAQQIEQFAQMLLPQVPDQRLLYTGNPQDGMLYVQLKAEYDAAVSQHQQMQSQAQQARQQASQIAEYQHNLVIQAAAAEIAEKLGTEWTEPSERQKLQETLYPIGKELGYSDEAMADANASDLLALKMAHSWKAKADKYDALQKAKMEPVRAAKQIPRSTQPGSAGAQGQQAKSVSEILYPNDVRR